MLRRFAAQHDKAKLAPKLKYTHIIHQLEKPVPL